MPEQPFFAIGTLTDYICVMPKSLPGRALVAFRLTFGPMSWLTPNLVMVAMGGDPSSNPQASYMSRLFGVRDLILGVGVLCSRGSARRLWWQLGIACDAADTVAGVLAVRGGAFPNNLRTRASVLAEVTGVCLGAAALASDEI